MCVVIEECGVVVLVILGDVVLVDIVDDCVVVIEWVCLVVVLSGLEFEKVVMLLNVVKNVMIFVGVGVEGVYDEVIVFVDKFGVLIVYVLCGKEFIEYDNFFDVGMMGLFGFVFGYWVMEVVDVLLVLGSDFLYE